MKQKLMTPEEKVHSCLEYIDERLENTSEQTLRIAETIIDDIKSLSNSYKDAIESHRLREHADKVHNTQMKWVNQLHDIILDQTNRELNNQVIQALQNFVNNLNKKQMKHLDFELPKAVDYQFKNGKPPVKTPALPFKNLMHIRNNNPTKH